MNMKPGAYLLLLPLIFLLSLATNVNAQKKVVGYYAYWYKSYYPADKIDYKNLTHIIHSFISPSEDGSIIVPDNFIYPELISTAHNAGVKVLVSLGGADSAATQAFVIMSSNAESRSRFVGNLVDFILQNNYDGADIDWEFPVNDTEKVFFTDLVTEIRTAFNNINTPLLLTMAANPGPIFGQYFEYEKFIKDLDWLNVMGYDFRGSWSKYTGHNAPLYANPNDPAGEGSDNDGIIYLNTARKIPKEKLVLGVPFFGKEFEADGLFKTVTENSQVTNLIYNTDVYPKLNNPDWEYSWDEVSMVPYLVDTARTKFITFDDSSSIKLKCEYVKNNNLAGIMIWALGYDFVNGQSQLLKTIGVSLGLTTGVELADYQHEIPPGYKLFDNYPNPFNPTTTIKYSIPYIETQQAASRYVVLKIYDALGREITTLVNEIKSPGIYNVKFDGNNLPSGVYFYRLTAGEYVQTKKMTLIK